MRITASKLSLRNTTRHLVLTLIVLATLIGGYFIVSNNSQPAKAAGAMGFELFATHPYASNTGYDNTSTNYYTGAQLCPPPASFCPVGQTLIDMNVTDDGQLVAGYGDWDSNVDSFGVEAGRVGVMPLDLNTGEWGDMFLAGSEALDVVRKINGHLYIPTTDPSDKAATGNSTGNIPGYITNDTGDWRFVENGPRNSIHVFDVGTRDGTDLWTAGSSSDVAGGVAVARQSTDGGETWENALLGPGGGLDRFYTLAAIDDRIYMKASNSSVTRSFDGSTWQDESEVPCVSYMDPKLVEVFDGRIVCGPYGGNSLSIFDGESSSRLQLRSGTSDSSFYIRDFYVTDDYLYVLTTAGVLRTSSLSDDSKWEHFPGISIPTGVLSIVVDDDYIYLGGTSGRIFKSSSPISETDKELISNSDTACFNFNPDSGTITNYYYAYEGCGTDVVIPDSIDGMAVRAIAGNVFSRSSPSDPKPAITSVSIPDTVTRIAYGAFRNNDLTEVHIPDSVTNLEANVFNNNNISELPEYFSNPAVTTIPAYTFSGNNLSSLKIPSNIQTVGLEAFDSNQITELILHDSIQSIGARAFRYNQIATDVTIPSSMTSLASDVFSYNNITNLVIPSSITTMSGAFIGNPLDTLTINVSNIPNSTQFRDLELSKLTIGDTVVSIGSQAFTGTVADELEVNMAAIPASIFRNMNLTGLTLGSSVRTIGWHAFRDNAISELSIPDSVTSIGSYAFQDNQITELTIPDSVTTIGNSAFLNNQIAELAIPNSVTSLHSSSFNNNPLDILSINMTAIPVRAFEALEYGTISKLTLGESVVSIGNEAFSNNQLTELTIPASVTSVGDAAFSGNLLDVVHIKGQATLGSRVFDNSTDIVRAFTVCIITLQPPAVTLDDYVPCYEEVFAQENIVSNLVKVFADHPDSYSHALYREETYAGLLGLDSPLLGGHVINPTQANISYRDQAGVNLHDPISQVGPKLADYSISSLLAEYPDVDEDSMSDAYYRQGQTVQFTPLAIPGYIQPGSLSVTLAGASQSVPFVYSPVVSTEADDETESGADIGAPNTGLSQAFQVGGLVLVGLVLVTWLVWRKLSSTKSKRSSFRL